jgi:tagatose-1,6-bisphosphate aldolase non-catalytic subunit AgaZ/GatZ
MNFKLGFGPMSPLIVDILAGYAVKHERPMMIIASRNQIDADGGYVMTTPELARQLESYPRGHIKLCRDHCGPYFLDSEKDLTLIKAVEATKKTIATDIANGFDLIHIDTSRWKDPYTIADELFNYALKLNPDIRFEFGTEENVGVAAGVKRFKKDVEFVKKYPNVDFVVAQTGSLTYEDRQYGKFDAERVAELVKYAESAGVKLKEHNADYLTPDEIQLRRTTGVHAVNIAPQLGVIQTRTLLHLAMMCTEDSQEFRQAVLASNKWTKWTKSKSADIRVLVAGHYCFNTDAYHDLVGRINRKHNFEETVKTNIEKCLDLYYTNLY